MSEFKIPSHNKRYKKQSANRLVFMIFVLVGIIVFFMSQLHKFSEGLNTPSAAKRINTPEAKSGVVYHKPGFSLSYVEEYELPEWVAYELTVDMMNKPKQERTQDFEPDPSITTGSGHYRDYKSSGYRRGHLVPSADMAWNKESMDATFLLSNVSPMLETFNDGIWLELEHNVRDWSRRYKHINVVTGPLFNDPVTTIGDNEILVPRYFYKAVFAMQEETPIVIGFLFNQSESNFGPLDNYVVSLDSIEKVTGIDLFSGQYGDWDAEIQLEKREIIPQGEWPFNERWYKQRIDEEERSK